MGEKIEVYKITLDYLAKVWENPKTAVVVIALLTSLGFNFAPMFQGEPGDIQVNVETPGNELGPIESRIATLEAHDKSQDGRIRTLEKIHE